MHIGVRDLVPAGAGEPGRVLSHAVSHSGRSMRALIASSGDFLAGSELSAWTARECAPTQEDGGKRTQVEREQERHQLLNILSLGQRMCSKPSSCLQGLQGLQGLLFLQAHLHNAKQS